MTSITDTQNAAIWRGPRMVVFVPGLLENVADFTEKVYAQALAQHRWVLYLTLAGRDEDQLAAARLLSTITALTESSAVHASALQVNEQDRTTALREITHPGDLVIWPEERLLAPEALANTLGITQQVLPGVRASAAFRRLAWFQALLFWLCGLAILVGFTYFELRLDGLLDGWPLKMGLIGLFLLEVGAFSLWDRIFG